MNSQSTHQVTLRSDSEREKALRILAKSIFKQLKSQGYDSKQVVGLATELIAQVTTDLVHESDLQR